MTVHVCGDMTIYVWVEATCVGGGYMTVDVWVEAS